MHTKFRDAERNLGRWCDPAGTGETVIIRRDDGEDVALVSASELPGLIETMHLIRSPKNAMRLFTALGRSRAGTRPTADGAGMHGDGL